MIASMIALPDMGDIQMDNQSTVIDRPLENDIDIALDVDLALDSVAVRRLIEEVRVGEAQASRHYNRTYNRHNR